MAKVKTSAIITDIKGTLDATIYSRNHSGLYSKGYFSNPDIGSPKQLTQRAHVKSLSQYWRVLSESDRLKWILETQNHNRHNCYGDSYRQDPFHFYLSCNLNRMQIGLPRIDVPSCDSSVGDLFSFSLDTSDPDPNFWNMNFPGQSTNNKTAYLIYATPGLSAGIYYCKSKYLYIGYIPLNTSVSYSFGVDYAAIFPTPASGEKIFVKIRPININSGIDGNLLINFSII